MPKNNKLSELFELLDLTAAAPPEKSSTLQKSKNYFLFLLGTGTIFVKEPQVAIPPAKITCYERGESLSYLAQSVVDLFNETQQVEFGPTAPAQAFLQPLAYSSPSVDVLNGPTTRGTEVGDRIAQAVFLALRAVASGKTSLQITAHSRGAVEATLVLHELERIKKALEQTPDKTLKQILSESPCKYTAAAFLNLKLFPLQTAVESPEARARLLTKLNQLKKNVFLIDPVPGDTKYGLPGITWHDTRFYLPPPCDNHEWLLAQHERSNCFYPIVPLNVEPEDLPGAHGTHTGNSYTQQVTPLHPDVLKDGKSTTSVQDLVLCKWFRFMNQVTGEFSPPARGEGEKFKFALKHPALDKIVNTYLNLSESDRWEYLLEGYNKVARDLVAYQYLTTTAYYGVGRTVGDRLVHFRGQKLTTMPMSSQEGLVNVKHARLYLQKYIPPSVENETDLEVQIRTIDNVMQLMIHDIETGENRGILAVIKSPATRSFFYNSLSSLVDSVSQKYLRNHLTLDEKSRLLSVITRPFRQLAVAKGKAKEDPRYTEYSQQIEQIEAVLTSGLKSTISTHIQSLIQRSKDIDKQVVVFLETPARLNEQYKGLVEVSDEDSGDLKELKERLSKINPVDITRVRQVLTDFLSELDLKEKPKEIILESKSYVELCGYIEALERPVDDYLSTIQELYESLISLWNSYLTLKDLGCDIPSEHLHTIGSSSKKILEQAGLILQRKDVDLSTRPEQLNEAFFKLIRQEVAAADNEKMTTLRQQQSTIASLNKEVAGYVQANQELQRQLSALKDVHEALSREKTQLLSGNQALQMEVDALKTFQEALKLQAKQDGGTIDTLGKQVNSQAKSLATLTEEKRKLIEVNKDLSVEVGQYLTGLKLLTKEHEVVKEKMESLLKTQATLDATLVEMSKEKNAVLESNMKLQSEVETLRAAEQGLTSQAKIDSERIAALEHQQASQALLIEELSQENEGLMTNLLELALPGDQDRLKAAFDRQTQDHRRQREGLVSDILAKDKQAAALTAEANKLQAKLSRLNTPIERKAGQLIETELLPLTTQYMQHLLKEAQKYFPYVESNDYARVLPTGNLMKDPASKADYQKIRRKFVETQQLHSCLMHSEQFPTERLQSFRDTLNEYAGDLKTNRDLSWMSYVKSCLAVIAVFVSGVIPAVVYSMATGKSALFFAEHRTTGASYVSDCHKHLDELHKSSPAA